MVSGKKADLVAVSSEFRVVIHDNAIYPQEAHTSEMHGIST